MYLEVGRHIDAQATNIINFSRCSRSLQPQSVLFLVDLRKLRPLKTKVSGSKDSINIWYQPCYHAKGVIIFNVLFIESSLVRKKWCWMKQYRLLPRWHEAKPTDLVGFLSIESLEFIIIQELISLVAYPRVARDNLFRMVSLNFKYTFFFFTFTHTHTHIYIYRILTHTFKKTLYIPLFWMQKIINYYSIMIVTN